MKEHPKILVYAPTYVGKQYVTEEFINNILNLEYPNYDILIQDNTEKRGKYYKLLERLLKQKGNAKNVKLEWVRRGANSRMTLTKCHNRMREYFLAGDYDYLMSIESDLLPPKNIISHLMKIGGDVSSALYYIGIPGGHYELHKGKKYGFSVDGPMPLIHLAGTIDGVNFFTMQLHPDLWDEYVNSGIRRVHGCGIGCALIKREVIKEIKFRIEQDKFGQPIYRYHDDTFFYLDCWNHKPQFEVLLDTDLVIEHRAQDWAHVVNQGLIKY